MSLKQPTISLGITGGIGSGKTYVCHSLEQKGIPIFYTDTEARNLMIESEEIHGALEQLIGIPCILPNGTLNKPALSEYIRISEKNAQQIDNIVHPHVIQRIKQWIKESDTNMVGIESALLFKSRIDKIVDYTLLVTAPTDLKIKRVMERDGKSREEIVRWMSLQTSDEELRKKVDFVITNEEGGSHSIEVQVAKILQMIGCE